ncbi:hypothetical protein BJY04DRAFT_223261 [Aspergillus karnatakaensis]|uniref:uncharacterized protein n=1 Tax=Aspergillus karnatakaensis TaxID=1810916 RepID=UPI003CCDF402
MSSASSEDEDLLENIRNDLSDAVQLRNEPDKCFVARESLKQIWTDTRLKELATRFQAFPERVIQEIRDKFIQVLSILVWIRWDKWESFYHLFVAQPNRSDDNVWSRESVFQGLSGTYRGSALNDRLIFCPIDIVEGQDLDCRELRRLPLIETHSRGPEDSGGWSTSRAVVAGGHLQMESGTEVSSQEKKLFIWVRSEKAGPSQNHAYIWLMKRRLKTHAHLLPVFAAVSIERRCNLLFAHTGVDIESVLSGHLGALSLNDLLLQSANLADALVTLHQRTATEPGMCHMDLKPANIEIVPDPSSKVGIWKITRLGVSKSAFPGRRQPYRLASRPGIYDAPGIDSFVFYVPPDDIWSFACIIVRLLAFSIGGTQELETFDQLRSRVNTIGQFFMHDYFESENKVCPARSPPVEEWLIQLPQRASDSIPLGVCQSLSALLLRALEIKLVRRPGASEVRDQLNEARSLILDPESSTHHSQKRKPEFSSDYHSLWENQKEYGVTAATVSTEADVSDDQELECLERVMGYFASHLKGEVGAAAVEACAYDLLQEFAWRLHAESTTRLQREFCISLCQLDTPMRKFLLPGLGTEETAAWTNNDGGDILASLEEIPDGFNADLPETLWVSVRTEEEAALESFILESAARAWLVLKLSQPPTLTSIVSGAVSPVGDRLLRKLLAQQPLHKLGRARVAVVAMLLKLEWDLDTYLEDLGREPQTLDAVINRSMCLVGTWLDARFSTLREYLKRTWPDTWHHIVRLIEHLITSPSGQRFQCGVSGSGHAEMSAEVRQPHMLLCTVTGSPCTSDTIIWHLIVNNNKEERISYDDPRLQKVDLPSMTNIPLRVLAQCRHIVGWCSTSIEYYGHAAACMNPSPSGLPISPASIIVDRLYIEGGAQVVGGLSMGINMKQKPFWLRQEDDYPSLLQWVGTQSVLFYDTKETRSWLVDGLSALLHLVRTSLHLDGNDSDSTFDWVFNPSKLQDSKPGSKQSSMRSNALHTLTHWDNLELPLYVKDSTTEHGQTVKVFSTFGERVKKLLRSLELLVDQQSAMASQNGIRVPQTWKLKRRVSGFDVLDILRPVGPIGTRVMTLETPSRTWLDFTQALETTVIFGSGFGDLITPKDPSTICQSWQTVPQGRGYMAVSISTLNMLYEKRLQRIYPLLNTGELTDKILWVSPCHPFKGCCCIDPSARYARCKFPVQHLFSRDIFSRGIPNGSSLIDLATLDTRGAVVFGM